MQDPKALIATTTIILVSVMATAFVVSFFLKPEPPESPKIKIKAREYFGVRGFFEMIMEKVILCRWDHTGYGNQPSANIRLLPCLITTGFITLASVIVWVCLLLADPLNSEAIVRENITPIRQIASERAPALENKKSPNYSIHYYTVTAAFIGLWLGLFWKEKKDLHNKWEYLASLQNNIFQKPPTKAGDYSSRNVLRATFAIDCLVMEMWAHRTFRGEFHDILKEAITSSGSILESEFSQFEHGIITNPENDQVFEKYLEDSIAYKEALTYLEKYREYQIRAEKFQFQTIKRIA